MMRHMSTSPIVPSVLGLAAERAIRDDVRALSRVLGRLDDAQWQRETPLGGATIAQLAGHLAEGAQRLADAWRSRLDVEANEALLHTFDDPDTAPKVEMDTSDGEAVLSRYRSATTELDRTLSGVRQEDWSWPVWSPLGGLETLGEAARRWLAHHHVHRADILSCLGRPLEESEDTGALVVEFVLDALARRGGDVITPPLIIEVVTTLPGAGTWNLIFEDEQDRHEVDSVFMEIMRGHREDLPRHRVERGSSHHERLTLRSAGDRLWRAAFGRGASFDDLEVHGDDEARAQWRALVDAVSAPAGRGLGRVQH